MGRPGPVVRVRHRQGIEHHRRGAHREAEGAGEAVGQRGAERQGDFGPTFVALARAVYKTNDERADIKRAINLALGSRLIEEKSYSPYA